MSSSRVVAASIAAVEALKDQAGLCRWNYALKSLQQHAKANLRSLSQAKSSADRGGFISAAASSTMKGSRRQAEKADRVYHLVCWGPN